MNDLAQQVGILNPLDYKYYLRGGRYVTTTEILGQRKYHSHLVYAHSHQIPFENFLEMLASGFIVHHQDENKQNDKDFNLQLLPKGCHHRYHNSGEKNTMWGKHPSLKTLQKMSQANMGKSPSIETRQKMSKIKKGKYLGEKSSNYNHNLRNEDIIGLVINQKISACQTAKILGVSKCVIQKRLKSLKYKAYGKPGSHYFIWKGNAITEARKNIEEV